VLSLWRVHSDEPHALTALQKKRIAINHTLNNIKIALCDGLIWWIEKGRELRNDDDAGNGPRPTVMTRQFANGHSGPFSTGGTKASRRKLAAGSSQRETVVTPYHLLT